MVCAQVGSPLAPFMMRRFSRRCAGYLPAVLALVSAISGCSPQDPGQVRFLVTSTPPPDDQLLSPLMDPRLTSLELRHRDASNLEVVLGRVRYERPGASGEAAGRPGELSLGHLPVGEKRAMQLVALGAAGQQVLGLALTRDVEVRFGAPSPQEYVFELRRPLFFFAGGPRLKPPKEVSFETPALSPGSRIFDGLRDEVPLRVLDPNSGSPLLSAYDLRLSPTSPAVATDATSDGLSVLVATQDGKLHIVETLRLKATLSIGLPDLSVQSISVSPRDDSAVILHYEPQVVMPAAGKPVGRVTFLQNLAELRSRIDKDGRLLSLPIENKTPGVIEQPLAAAYAPDGLVDVVFGKHPILGEEPRCAMLAGPGKSVLRRYDPMSGEVRFQAPIEYTTQVAYTLSGEQVLTQPCEKAQGAGPEQLRPGRVLLRRFDGQAFVPQRTLPAPGTAALSLAAGRSSLVAVGRNDAADSPTGRAQGTVRVLFESGAGAWSAQSSFPLGDWLLPYRVTIDERGEPLPASVEIVLQPRDFLVYRSVVTPDRARALIASRVTHQAEGVYIADFTAGTKNYRCDIDWLGYTYHLMLINLQTGAREQDWMVGVENHSCGSDLYEVDAQGNPRGSSLGPCFTECQSLSGGVRRDGRLKSYREGFIPGGMSALFGGH